MRLFRPFLIFGAVLGVFAVGAQIQSHRAVAQLSSSPQGTRGNPIDNLPAPPTLGSPAKPLPRLTKPLPAPVPVVMAVPRPTPVPVLTRASPA